jgi:hypothetical protein
MQNDVRSLIFKMQIRRIEERLRKTEQIIWHVFFKKSENLIVSKYIFRASGRNSVVCRFRNRPETHALPA